MDDHDVVRLGEDRSDRAAHLAPRLRTLATTDLTGHEIDAIRALMTAAFGTEEDDRFSDDDWRHALGGTHFVLELGAEIVSHASVVEREVHVDGRPLRTGYVEAVATAPDREGKGYGSVVMDAVGAHIRAGFELGALGTGRRRFYERLGWARWLGPSSVRTPAGAEPTPDDDGYIMILATPTSPPFDRSAPISCDWRPGDVW